MTNCFAVPFEEDLDEPDAADALAVAITHARAAPARAKGWTKRKRPGRRRN